MQKKQLKLWLFLFFITLPACLTGTDSISVISTPEEAKVYANDRYIGKSPQYIPVRWYQFLIFLWGENYIVRVEKEGYQTTEEEFVFADRRARYLKGEALSWESRCGFGSDFPFIVYLQKNRVPNKKKIY